MRGQKETGAHTPITPMARAMAARIKDSRERREGLRMLSAAAEAQRTKLETTNAASIDSSMMRSVKFELFGIV